MSVSGLLRQHRLHPRIWSDYAYAYPVISRRSGGLSIGVNLNPNGGCNFRCVYCQVERAKLPRSSAVEIPRLEHELRELITHAKSGALFNLPAFADVPEAQRGIRDIAISGNGEPTLSPIFCASVSVVAKVRLDAALDAAKIVLITNACFLSRTRVAAGLAILDANRGEIWAKLDAGSESYFQLVNQSKFSLDHVMANVIAAARVRPIVIQSAFVRFGGVGPCDAELRNYVNRLHEIKSEGGCIARVQIYTVARRPSDRSVTALPDEELDRIADMIRATSGLPVASYYGGTSD